MSGWTLVLAAAMGAAYASAWWSLVLFGFPGPGGERLYMVPSLMVALVGTLALAMLLDMGPGTAAGWPWDGARKGGKP